MIPLPILRSTLLLLLALSPSALASDGAPVQRFLDLLAQANQDGQFSTHLAPITHPQLVKQGLTHPFMPDGKASPDLEITNHQLRPITPQEVEELAAFFDFPVAPTHVLTIEQAPRTPNTGLASRRLPLQLAQAPNGFWLVFGTVKPRDLADPPQQRFTFIEDRHSWLHRWTLQFLPNEGANLALVVSGPDGTEMIRLWDAADSPLRANQPRLSVQLWPEQDQAAFREGTGGETSVAFGWSSGPKGEASAFTLPFPASACTYQHVPDPVEHKGRVPLATFTGPGNQAYTLEVRRIPAAP